jgi:hypothetical protein
LAFGAPQGGRRRHAADQESRRQGHQYNAQQCCAPHSVVCSLSPGVRVPCASRDGPRVRRGLRRRTDRTGHLRFPQQTPRTPLLGHTVNKGSADRHGVLYSARLRAPPLPWCSLYSQRVAYRLSVVPDCRHETVLKGSEIAQSEMWRHPPSRYGWPGLHRCCPPYRWPWPRRRADPSARLA